MTKIFKLKHTHTHTLAHLCTGLPGADVTEEAGVLGADQPAAGEGRPSPWQAASPVCRGLPGAGVLPSP